MVSVAEDIGHFSSPRIFESSMFEEAIDTINSIPDSLVFKFILLLCLLFYVFCSLLAYRKQSGNKTAPKEEHQKMFHVIFQMVGICHCLRLTWPEGVTDRLLTRLHNHHNQPTLIMTVELPTLTAICRQLLWKRSVWCQVRDK